jgi:hypothetical protein
MPGFVAAVIVDAEARLGVVTAANTTYGGDRELVTVSRASDSALSRRERQ